VLGQVGCGEPGVEDLEEVFEGFDCVSFVVELELAGLVVKLEEFYSDFIAIVYR